MKKFIKPILITVVIASLSVFATGCGKKENTEPQKIDVEVDESLNVDVTVEPAETTDPINSTPTMPTEINESLVTTFNVEGSEIVSSEPGIILLSTVLSFDELTKAIYDATKTANITETSKTEEVIEGSKVWSYLGTYEGNNNISIAISEAGPEGGKIVNAIIYYTK